MILFPVCPQIRNLVTSRTRAGTNEVVTGIRTKVTTELGKIVELLNKQSSNIFVPCFILM